jgi:ornithine carbamoyltransferase
MKGIIKNFISTIDWSKEELQEILDYAKDLKNNRFNDFLKNKSIALLFFNSSMRTRTSFDISLKSLSILPKLIKSIKLNKKNSLEYIDNEMKMTDKVYALVSEGTPFRDAYNKVKNSNDLSQVSETTRSNYSEGSPGNLKLNVFEKRLSKQR